MKIIAGLGNPGEKYKYTRHNAGFLAVDYFLEHNDFYNGKPSKNFESEVLEVPIEAQKVLFLKPQTFMNDSGLAVKAAINFYKINAGADLLIIHDEVDLPLGVLRLADNSSAAGHNGVQSIIDNLGTQSFNRLRIGVETRMDRTLIPTEEFVLQKFPLDELEKFNKEVLPKVHFEIEKFIKNK